MVTHYPARQRTLTLLAVAGFILMGLAPARAAAQEPFRWQRNVPGETRPVVLNADDVATWVENEGPDIRPVDLDGIFDKFWTRRRGGSGLGLAICRGIVEAHGGRIRAENRRGGPRFTFTLPTTVPSPLSGGEQGGGSHPSPLGGGGIGGGRTGTSTEET